MERNCPNTTVETLGFSPNNRTVRFQAMWLYKGCSLFGHRIFGRKMLDSVINRTNVWIKLLCKTSVSQMSFSFFTAKISRKLLQKKTNTVAQYRLPWIIRPSLSYRDIHCLISAQARSQESFYMLLEYRYHQFYFQQS